MNIDAEIYILRKRKPSEEIKVPWLIARDCSYHHGRHVEDSFETKVKTKEYEKNIEEIVDFQNKLLSIKREGNTIVRIHKDKDGAIYTEKKDLTKKNIDELAKDIGILSGKWLVFLNSLEVDEIWFKVGEAVIKGELGPLAKIGTRKQAEENNDDKYVICLYTANYLDEADVMGVEEKLRELNIKKIIYYKPDIYTILDIYSGETILPASRYISR